MRSATICEDKDPRNPCKSLAMKQLYDITNSQTLEHKSYAHILHSAHIPTKNGGTAKVTLPYFSQQLKYMLPLSFLEIIPWLIIMQHRQKKV